MFGKKTLSLIISAALVIACCNSLVAIPRDTEVLKVGSKAPDLDIEHWVSNGKGKFKPVKKFENGKVYVVEFWATWCPPCIASMPHLNRVQRKFSNKGLQIISISDEDLTTVQEFLKTNVLGDAQQTYAQLTASYCLTADPDNSSHSDYMEAAQQEGIPAAFIIGKTGSVEWICHPMEIEEPLEMILDDKWDSEAYARKKKAEQEAEEKLMNEIEQRVNSAIDKMRDGDNDAAVKILDEVIEEHKAHRVVEQIRALRFRMLMSLGGEKAASALTEFAAENKDPQMLNQLAWTVVEMKMSGDDVDDQLVAAATSIAKKALVAEPDNGPILDTLAHLVHIGGDLDKAIELQKKALANAGDMKSEIEPYLEVLLKEKAEQEKAALREKNREKNDQ